MSEKKCRGRVSLRCRFDAGHDGRCECDDEQVNEKRAQNLLAGLTSAIKKAPNNERAIAELRRAQGLLNGLVCLIPHDKDPVQFAIEGALEDLTGEPATRPEREE